jgi:predicted amidohydrolase
MTKMVEKLGSKNDLIVFPELSLTGYGGDPSTLKFRKNLWKHAEEIPGPSTSRMERAAEETGCYVAFGAAERGKRLETVYNAAVLVGPEGYVGHARKTHLVGVDDSPYAGGNRIESFRTKIGRLGLMVCYDMWFPEVGRILTLGGAEVILILSSSFIGGSSGGIGSRQSKQVMWDILPRAIALTNLVHVVACDGSGKVFMGKKLGYWERLGRTRIVDALGRIVGETKRNRATVVEGILERKTFEEARSFYSLLHDRKPKLYKPMVK